MDTEVSTTHPESWRRRIPEETFSEVVEGDAGVRDFGAEHPAGPHSHGDGYSTPICGERGSGTAQRADGESTSEKVSVVGEGVLERKSGVVTGLFCFHDRDR